MAFNWPEPTLTVSNRLGIGTDNPSQALEVTGNIAATGDISGASLTVNNAIATQQLSVSGSVTDSLIVENDLTVNNAITTQQLTVSDRVIGSLIVDDDLTVNNAITTNQLTVSDRVIGSLIVDDDLTVNNVIATKQLTVTDQIKGSLTIENNLSLDGNVGIGTSNSAFKLVVAGGETSLQQESWQTPILINGWVNYGDGYNDAGYFKDSLGIVHLKGLVKNGIADTIFTLPLGYRPSGRELHGVSCVPNTIGRVDILTDGTIQRVQGDNRWISLDGITFRAG